MTRAPKRPRSERRPTRFVLNLTERDLDVLTLTAIAKVITTAQIARDCFVSMDRARRRLRVLFDVGYLQVTILDSKQPSLFSITRKGVKALLDARPGLGKRIRLPGPIRLAGLTRHLLQTDVRLFAAALGELRAAPLVRWCPGSAAELRPLGLDTFGLMPDAVAEFATGCETTLVCIEIELGVTSDASLHGRCVKYAELARRRVVDALWWVNAGGTERGVQVRRQLARHELADWSRVVPLRQLLVRPAALPDREQDGDRAVGANRSDADQEKSTTVDEVAPDSAAVDRTADRRGDGWS